MKEGYFVIRTYEAGAIGEKTKFFVPGKRPEGRMSRRQKNALRKAEQNEYSAQKALARKINANYGAGDILLGLDYNDMGMKRICHWARKNGLGIDSEDEIERQNALWEAAAHELDIALRRVKRKLEKNGVELKAIYCTSDMDGDTGEIVRVHHHLIVNGETKEAFVEAWEKYGLGSVDWEYFWPDQLDRTPIAEYIIRQVRRIPDAKKYRTTRNVITPKGKDRVVYTDKELQVPRGGVLVFRQGYETKQTFSRESMNRQSQYIRYILPEHKCAVFRT